MTETRVRNRPRKAAPVTGGGVRDLAGPPAEDRGLELVGAAKRFGEIVALDDVSLEVRPERVLGFLGPNGAGKTTAMRAVFGLVELDAGDVVWDGGPVGLTERLRFGYMPEERGLYPRMALGDQLVYFGSLHGLTAAAARAAASEWLERLDLADRAGAKVEELSHGNQQRAQLAAALLHEPELLVLDEPFGRDSIPSPCARSPRCSAARRPAVPPFSSRAISSSSWRMSARTSRSSTTAASSPPGTSTT